MPLRQNNIMEQKFNFKKIFLVTMIISLSVSALIGIFVFLFGDFKETEFRMLTTTLAIGGYSLTGLCCSALYEKRKFTSLALFGMIISVIGFFYTVLVIWKAIGIEDSWKALIIFVILAFSTAHSSLLLLIKPKKALVYGVLSATVIFILIVALMLIKPVLNEFPGPGEFYYRVLGVFAILDVLGTILVPILNKV